MERPVTCMTCEHPITWTGTRFHCRCKKPPTIQPDEMPALVSYMNSVENPSAQPRPVEDAEVNL